MILCLVLLWGMVPAQNWVLINPEYHYNFNNDGSDTIKYQLRATQVDTLGFDSIRYALPLVAQPCSDCGDTCNVRFNVPQFFRRTCLATTPEWRFTDPQELVIIPQAQYGDSWLFNPLDSISGTIIDVSEEEVLGAMDSVRTMATSMQDTVRWAKNHGLVLWHLHDELRYSLIGIRGLNVGRIVPPLTAFYPYQPGDVVVVYSLTSSNMQLFDWTYRYDILERTDTPGHIVFTVNKNWRFSGPGLVAFGYDTAVQWIADSLSTPALGSWPGQLVEVGQSVDGYPNYIVARHKLGPGGTYIITAADLGGQSPMFPMDTVPEDCAYVFMPYGNPYQLTAGLGSSWSYNYMIEGSGSTGIVGAIIGGDTIGTVFSDGYFHVGIEEIGRIQGLIAPNPSTGRFTLVLHDAPSADSFYSVYDAVGKLLFQRSLKPSQESEEIDLTRFGAGTYGVRVSSREGVWYERVVVQ